MKLVGLMPVRNEAWCLGLTLRAALQWCDEMVVLLHACTDDSARIVDEVDSECSKWRVNILHAAGPWEEMDHRQKMLEYARKECYATHIALIDADEILTGNLLPTTTLEGRLGPRNIRDLIEGVPAGVCMSSPGYNLRGSLDRYHSNGVWGNRWFSTAFVDDARLSWSGQKFHSREPRGRELKEWRPIVQGQGGVMHLWGANERRLRAKHALYKVTERLQFPHKLVELIELTYNDWRSPADNLKHWDEMNEWGKPWTFATAPAIWWQPYADILHHLKWDEDVELWQEAETRRLVAEHGRERFAGLDLFGVA